MLLKLADGHDLALQTSVYRYLAPVVGIFVYISTLKLPIIYF